MDTNNFQALLNSHLKLVRYDMNKVVLKMVEKSQTHDLDKVFNPIVFNIYSEHFPELKKIPFGTEEYKMFEKTHFPEAHEIHAQNDHHYYSHRNTQTKPNLLDLLEAVIDINASDKQYGNSDCDYVLQVLKDKKVLDVDIEEFVKNTLDLLNEEKNGQ